MTFSPAAASLRLPHTLRGIYALLPERSGGNLCVSVLECHQGMPGFSPLSDFMGPRLTRDPPLLSASWKPDHELLPNPANRRE